MKQTSAKETRRSVAVRSAFADGVDFGSVSISDFPDFC